MIGIRAARRARVASVLALVSLAHIVSCTSENPDGDDGGGAGGAESSGGSGEETGGASSGGAGPSSGGVHNTGGVPSSSGGFGGLGGLGGASGGTSPTGGSGGGDTGGTGGTLPDPEIYVSTAADLAGESAYDYGDNEYGIVTGNRLKSWIEDWEGNRPAGIDGDLVIVQVVAGVTPFYTLASNEAEGVRSYVVNSAGFNTPRNNGFSNFETDIPDGATADAFFQAYDIDPTEDLIVLTFEQQAATQNSVVQSVGRAWVFFKYWGTENEHIAILNGSLNFNAKPETYGLALSIVGEHHHSDPPENGTFSVRDSWVDHTTLSISLEDLIGILEQRVDHPGVDDGIRIVDARGGAEAYGLLKATSTGRTNCTSYTGTAPNAKCSTPFEGRLKGAQSVPWTQFLDTAAGGFRFLPKPTVKSIFDTQSGWNNNAELTIQYCRTNQRSTVTGIVASVILGYPTRFYETSFIEWGHASAGPDPTGLGGAGNTQDYPNKHLVDADFAFRTDLDYLTEHAILHPNDAGAYVPGGTLGTLTQPVTWVDGPNYNLEADVAPAVPGVWPLLNPAATTTELSIDTDRAYLRHISIEELP